MTQNVLTTSQNKIYNGKETLAEINNKKQRNSLNNNNLKKYNESEKNIKCIVQMCYVHLNIVSFTCKCPALIVLVFSKWVKNFN